MSPIPRDHHLFSPGPKRVLALDGGGVRGALSIAFLERMEAILDTRAGREVRLGDYFDLIGGTSTGSIIAAALALGYRTDAIKRFYLDLAPLVFRRSMWRVQGLRAKFDARALAGEIVSIIGGRTLDSSDLITGFALVAKRMDSGSSWIVTNSPRAPYWATPPDAGFIGNAHYPLANLVRASTAAPHFFDPELIEIVKGGPRGLFVDGGLTPHNNPSLALFMVARARAFGLEWRTGPENLSFVSVGTGRPPKRTPLSRLARATPMGLAIHALMGMVADGQTNVLAIMQALGQCPMPWTINSEAGTLAGEFFPDQPAFRFLRYDAILETGWLAAELGMTFTEAEAARLDRFDDPAIMAALYDIGVRAAALQVQEDHFVTPV